MKTNKKLLTLFYIVLATLGYTTVYAQPDNSFNRANIGDWVLFTVVKETTTVNTNGEKQTTKTYSELRQTITKKTDAFFGVAKSQVTIDQTNVILRHVSASGEVIATNETEISTYVVDLSKSIDYERMFGVIGEGTGFPLIIGHEHGNKQITLGSKSYDTFWAHNIMGFSPSAIKEIQGVSVNEMVKADVSLWLVDNVPLSGIVKFQFQVPGFGKTLEIKDFGTSKALK
jgi:hypothetical protein